jgi:hypothetical protein
MAKTATAGNMCISQPMWRKKNPKAQSFNKEKASKNSDFDIIM